MAVKLNLAEFRDREASEKRARVLAVITEFGGQKIQPALVPEDDPASNELVLRLAEEVLFLRDQIGRVGARTGGQAVRTDSARTVLATGRSLTN
jgi:hypothetical protein